MRWESLEDQQVEWRDCEFSSGHVEVPGGHLSVCIGDLICFGNLKGECGVQTELAVLRGDKISSQGSEGEHTERGHLVRQEVLDEARGTTAFMTGVLTGWATYSYTIYSCFLTICGSLTSWNMSGGGVIKVVADSAMSLKKGFFHVLYQPQGAV